MSTAHLTKLLVRARSTGIALEPEDGSVRVSPKAKLSPELREDLTRHKAELSAYLRWNEEEAYVLWKGALSYLAPFYLEAGFPNFDLGALRELDAQIEDAFAREDMLVLRIAVREWVMTTRRAIAGHMAKDESQA